MTSSTTSDSLLRRLHGMGMPLSATLEIIAACHMRCIHCYVTHSRPATMDLPTLEGLFAQMAELGQLSVTFTGGEIAVRKDLYEIIAAARRHHFRVDLLSSGTLWDAADWQRIADLGVGYVRLSVYSLDPAVHDAVTLQKGSWEKSMATAHGLREHGIQVDFSCPVLSTNADTIPDFYAWCQDNGFGMLLGPTIYGGDQGDPSPRQTRATGAQLARLYADPGIKKLLQGAKEDPACAPQSEDRPCAVGENSYFINSVGDIYPCSMWREPAGNIHDESIGDIWYRSKVFGKARAVTLGSFQSCMRCGDVGACRPCAAANLEVHGDTTKAASHVCADTARRAEAWHGGSKQGQAVGAKRLRILA